MSFYTLFSFAQIKQFGGKKLTNASTNPFQIYDTGDGSDFFVFENDEILQLSHDDAESLPAFKVENTYFKIVKSINGEIAKERVFTLATHEYEKLIYNGQFTNWVKDKYLENRIQHINSGVQKYANKHFPNEKTPFFVKSKNGEKLIKEGESLKVVPTSKLKKITGYKKEHIYFERIDPVTRKVIPGIYYSIPTLELEARIKSDQFGSWLRKDYEKTNPISSLQVSFPKPAEIITIQRKPIPPKLLKEYTVKAGVSPIGLNGSKLNPGDKFYLEPGDGKNYIVKVKPKSNKRYEVNNENKDAFQNLFYKGNVSEGKYISRQVPKVVTKSPKKSTTPKVEIDPNAYKTQPTPKGATETAIINLKNIESAKPIIKVRCKEPDKDSKKKYKTCSAWDNYAQKDIKELLTPEEIRLENDAKTCILAGLQKTPKSSRQMKTAACKDGKFLDYKTRACRSQEYVAFVYKELSQTADCFKNVSLKEILPLVSAESKFNHNAFNYNYGTTQLNASGFLQSTQNVFKSQKIILTTSKNSGLQNRKSNFCKNIPIDTYNNPITLGRDVCERTDLRNSPKHNGSRKNLFLAMAQYSNFKHNAEKSMKGIENTYLKDTKMFDSKTREKIKVDIARLMHNRGDTQISSLIEMFFYDLFKGKNYIPNKTRDVQIGTRKLDKLNKKGNRVYKNDKSVIVEVPLIREHPHGNPNIHPLWGRPGFKAPLDHDEFTRYFSSYIFYESDRTGIGRAAKNKENTKVVRKVYSRKKGKKNLEPSDNSLEAEGGTYLYKIDCEQRLLTMRAQKIAKNQNVNCEYPPPTQKRLNEMQKMVGWYKNACEQKPSKKEGHARKSKNRKLYKLLKAARLANQRKCAAKNPYSVKSSKGTRLISNSKLKAYSNDSGKLYSCDSESLRGLAAKPLIEFYSKEPKVYE